MLASSLPPAPVSVASTCAHSALDYHTSKRYQDAAALIAASEGILPVHLDAICWGLSE